MPRSRAEVRAYFESWRPRLAASELAQTMTAFILQADVAFPPDLPAWSRPLQLPLARLFRTATISTYPRYMRSMFGLRQSAAEDLAARVVLRVAFAAMVRNPALYARLAEILVPTTTPIVAPALLGITPTSPETTTPREAQARYGFDVPAEAHQGMRAPSAGPRVRPGRASQRRRAVRVRAAHRRHGARTPSLTRFLQAGG